jgi:hypothetical protein
LKRLFMPCYLRRSKLRLLAPTIAVLGILLPGCDGSKDTTKANDAPVLGGADRQSTSSRVPTRSGGDLALTLTAAPMWAKTSSPVEFNLTAYAHRAPGAFGYRLRYGDGTNAAQEAVPLICLAGKGAPMRQTWHLAHHYKMSGRYRVSASVYVNCTSDHATAATTVNVM